MVLTRSIRRGTHLSQPVTRSGRNRVTVRVRHRSCRSNAKDQKRSFRGWCRTYELFSKVPSTDARARAIHSRYVSPVIGNTGGSKYMVSHMQPLVQGFTCVRPKRELPFPPSKPKTPFEGPVRGLQIPEPACGFGVPKKKKISACESGKKTEYLPKFRTLKNAKNTPKFPHGGKNRAA